MKKTAALAAALAAVLSLAVLAGCSEKKADTDAAAPAAVETRTPVTGTAYPKGSIKVGDKAECIVCAVNENKHGQEEAKAVLDYQEKTYAFCNEGEKAEFISNPTKYAQAQ
ncbi:MAG: hypothetical protein HY321_08875 [Armatimonadetes bacterium]|nr:hypothetical protein [Armatimonadota bacterium]